MTRRWCWCLDRQRRVVSPSSCILLKLRVSSHCFPSLDSLVLVADTGAADPERPDPRADGPDGNVLHRLFRTLTGGDRRSPAAALQEVAAAFGMSNAETIMDFVEGFLVDMQRSIANGLEAAAVQLRSEATTEAMAPSVEMVNSLISAAMPQIVTRMRTAMRDHLSFLENNAEFVPTRADAAPPAPAPAAPAPTATPEPSSTNPTTSKQPTLPPKKNKTAPGGLGLGGGLKKKPAPKAAKTAAASAAPVASAANPMQQMMGMLAGGGSGGGGANSNPMAGLLGGLMGGRPQQPEAPLDVQEVLAKEIQFDEEREMWRQTVDQMERMAAARGSNGAPELPPLGEVYLAAIPDGKSGGSALDQIFDL